MRIENDEGLADLLVSDEESKLCSGFIFTEGPVWLLQQDCLLFSDIPGNRIHRWRPAATEADVYREPSAHANGLTVDAAGRVLACEHSGRRVSLAPYGQAPNALSDKFEGKKFNSPNDLVVHSSGAVYFTDPTYGLMKPPNAPAFGDPNAKRELEIQGVYRLDPAGSLALVVDDFSQPNGLAFSPDESVLYIGDSADSVIRRFDVAADGSLSDGAIFVDMRNDDRRGVPDGMKVDEDGRLWSTGAGGVWVMAPDGRRLGVFEMDEHAANLTFGGPDFSALFLTAGTSVYRVETAVRGIAPGSR